MIVKKFRLQFRLCISKFYDCIKFHYHQVAGKKVINDQYFQIFCYVLSNISLALQGRPLECNGKHSWRWQRKLFQFTWRFGRGGSYNSGRFRQWDRYLSDTWYNEKVLLLNCCRVPFISEVPHIECYHIKFIFAIAKTHNSMKVSSLKFPVSLFFLLSYVISKDWLWAENGEL